MDSKKIFLRTPIPFGVVTAWTWCHLQLLCVRHVCCTYRWNSSFKLQIIDPKRSPKNDVRKKHNKSDLNLSLQTTWIGFRFITHRCSNTNSCSRISQKEFVSWYSFHMDPFCWSFVWDRLMANGAWWLDVLEDLAAEFTLGTRGTKCQVWIGLICFVHLHGT